MEDKLIDICPMERGHGEGVPLIATFAFDGAEYWCPYCGFTTGAFGNFKRVPLTTELIERLKQDEERSKEFLRAKGRQVAVEVKYKDEWIKPVNLPEDEKDRDREIIKDWKYEGAL